MFRHLTTWLLLLSVLSLEACVSRQQYELSGPTMGSSYRIKYVAKQAVNSQPIQLILKEINQVFSVYDDSSWISQFNQLPANGCLPYPSGLKELHDPVQTVFNEALEWSKQSDGAYDITIKPLMDVWGFGAHRSPNTPELNERVKAAQLINYQALDLQVGQLCKHGLAIQIDPNSLVAGYAVDMISASLESQGINDYLVEVTGELKAKGRHIDGNYWTIGLEAPNKNLQQANQIVQVDNLGISTSGDYRNYYEENGIRFSHTLDPKLLAPVTHHLAAVSVITPSAMRADALSTLLMILGPDRGLAFAQEHDIAALFVTRESDNEFTSTRSPAFNTLLTEASK